MCIHSKWGKKDFVRDNNNNNISLGFEKSIKWITNN